MLAPGLTANAHSFDGLMRAGLGDVARVIALDLRGRGESDAPPSGYAMEDHARDVLGLLDALGLERVVMGGHSFGGLLTYWLAANHPERVERCVVLDAPAVVEPDGRRPDPARARPPGPRPPLLGRVRRARQVDARTSTRVAGTPTSRATSAPTCGLRPDGTVQARSRPEHIAGGDPGHRSRSTGRRSSPASRSRRCSCVHPGASALPGRPRSSPARTRTGRRR